MRCIPLVLAFQLTAVFRIAAGPEAIDAETIVTARRPAKLRGLPIELLRTGLRRLGLRRPDGFSRPAGHFSRVDHNPLVDGNYLAFPRDRQAVLTIFDGRWEQPPHPVEWCINRYLALSGDPPRQRVRIDGVGDVAPGDCFAVATPYNQTLPDDVANHRSLYLSLFGFDVAAGQTVRARSRLQVIADWPTRPPRRLMRTTPARKREVNFSTPWVDAESPVRCPLLRGRSSLPNGRGT